MTRKILTYMVLVLLGGCIYEYNPDIEGSRGMLVINGKVTDREGYQYIEISRSYAPYDDLTQIPVSGFNVEIEDDKGNRFPGIEMEEGSYACWIDQEYLITGNKYRLIATDTRGKIYMSDFDELLECPDIDSITYEIQQKETEIPDLTYRGVQFMVNTDCSGAYAKHFRWDLEETWEYHSTYEITAYYDGRLHETLPGLSSDEYFYCWETRRIREIFTYSTQNLTSGQIRNYPLIFVTNHSDRLSYKYSLLVKQSSLSTQAYEFWSILEKQSRQSGELYETQPAQIHGNIYSQEAGGETVMGIFYATSVKEKRIFVSPEMSAGGPFCQPSGLSREELMDLLETYNPSQYPIYLVLIDIGVYDFAAQECFDCRLRGGTTIPPDFWE